MRWTRLNDVPAVWLITVPELPDPPVKDWFGKVTYISEVPTTSVSVPQFPLSLGHLAVPDSVILPLAKGVPADGLTQRPLILRVEFAPPWVFTVNVTVDAVWLVRATAPEPENAAVGGGPPVSQTNPLGAVRMIVPSVMCALPPEGLIIGPVRVVV